MNAVKNMPLNVHFRAAMSISERIPYLHTNKAKRVQQAAILRELLTGLKGGK